MKVPRPLVALALTKNLDSVRPWCVKNDKEVGVGRDNDGIRTGIAACKTVNSLELYACRTSLSISNRIKDSFRSHNKKSVTKLCVKVKTALKLNGEN